MKTVQSTNITRGTTIAGRVQNVCLTTGAMRRSLLMSAVTMTVCVILLCFPQTLFAQKDLNINEVFELYGKSKHAVMVNMSGEVLDDYGFSLFKSITVKNDPSAADFARKCLIKDEKGAKKIKQVVSNGVVTSIYLQLPPTREGNRLVLFNEKFAPVTQFVLIYIESGNDSEDILKLLLKKK